MIRNLVRIMDYGYQVFQRLSSGMRGGGISDGKEMFLAPVLAVFLQVWPVHVGYKLLVGPASRYILHGRLRGYSLRRTSC